MGRDMYDKGLEIRKAVLGEEYVANALARADAFNQPLQDLVTEYCWGAVWGRDGLARRDRSLINLAMIAILNRPHELRAHVRGALTNGLTRAEISEVLLQVAIYGGVPCAVDSFRIASETFAELDAAANASENAMANPGVNPAAHAAAQAPTAAPTSSASAPTTGKAG